MAIGTSRKRRPVWRQVQMPDGVHSWRLFAGPRTRQWSVEVHASIAGYVVCYFLGKVRGAPWFAHVYENLESAMATAEFFAISKRTRKDAARSRRAMLRTASTPPDIIARLPVWLMRNHDSGTMRLYGGGYDAWVHRWENAPWKWFVFAPPQSGTTRTRRDAMDAVEQALRLSAHERLHAWDALYEHLARMRALSRENVRRRRSRLRPKAR